MANNLIEILEGGRLSPSYSNSIDFKTIEEQNEYWEKHRIESREISTPIQIYEEFPLPLILSSPLKVTKKWNYMRVQVNTAAPNEPIKRKWYYYFITKVGYGNGQNSKLSLKLDVLQTYMFDFKFLESFVVREHQDRYDKNGDPIFNRLPEDLELGSDMVVSDIHPLGDRIHWYHIITKIALGVKSNFITDGTNIGPDYKANIGGLQQGFYHYIVPFDPENPNKEWKCIYRGKEYTLESAAHLTGLLSGSEQTHTIRYLGVAPLAFTINDVGAIVFDDNDTFILNQPNNVNFVLPDDEGTVPKPSKYVNVAFADTVNGKLDGPTTALPQTTYTVKSIPNDGYKLTKLYYNIEGGATGVEISLNTLTFVMPNAPAVTIYAEFAESVVRQPITYDPEVPDPKQFTRTGPTSVFPGTQVEIGTFAKIGYTAISTPDVQEFTRTGKLIKFEMPNKPVHVTTEVKVKTTYDIRYEFNFSEVGFRKQPSTFNPPEGVEIDVEAEPGYQLLGMTWKTESGKIIDDGYGEIIERDGQNIIRAKSGIYKSPQENLIIYVTSEVADKPRPPKPVYYNFVPKVVGYEDGRDVPFQDYMGWFKVTPTTYEGGETITIDAYAAFQIDEYTGKGGYVLALIKMFDAKGVEIKQYQLDNYDTVPGHPQDVYHYKARYKAPTDPAENPIRVSFKFVKKY